MIQDGNLAVCAQGSVLGGYVQRDVTLAQNIDNRITQLEGQITRLKRTKEQLAQPGGLLNVPLDDLRFAMSY